MFKYSFLTCLIGFLLDMLLGDPRLSWHPVRLIGRLINLCEKIFYRRGSAALQFMGGAAAALIVCAVSAGAAVCLCAVGYKINVWAGVAVQSILCYFMTAAKSLRTESMKVYTALSRGDIEAGRSAVAMLVGRDTDSLDKGGIIKAAVETVAENLSDGVIAPVFYMSIGGCAAGAVYKAVNTLDSMIGYKNDRYLYFGRFAARLDDALNFIPSRLSGVMIICAAFLCGMDYKNAARIFIRDRHNHPSPNSAQTESACAGALGLRLGGDAYYFGRLCKKPYIGDDIKQPEAEAVVMANRLMYGGAMLAVAFMGIITAVIQGGF